MIAATILPPHALRHPDGCVHFSDLKQFARSAAHYRHAVANPRESTRVMRIGTLVDRLVFGGELPPIWYGEKRQGNEWKAFALRHAGKDICTQAELDEARPIAAAVKEDPLAQEYLAGSPQVPLRWTMMGVECATRGVDLVGAGFIVDLKVTATTEPERWKWHARRMLYLAQLAFYREGCRQMGIDTSKGLFLCGVEAAAPHPVTVLRLSERALAEGEKCIHLWLEQLRACEASGKWPGYCQSVIELDTDGDVELVGLEDADEG